VTETTESLDTPTTDAPAAKGRGRRGEGLSGMVLTDLKALAGTLGIKGTSGMRKGDLVAAIAARQNGAGSGKQGSGPDSAPSASPTAPAADREASNGHSGDPALPLGELGGQPVEQSSAPAADSATTADQGQRGSERDRAASGDGSAEAEDGQRGRRNRRGRRDNRDYADSGTPQNAGVNGAAQTDTAPSGAGHSDTAQNATASNGAALNGAQSATTGEQSRGQQGRDRDNQGRDNQGRDGQARDNQGREGQARDNQGRDGQARDGQGRDRDQNRDTQSRDRDQNRDGQGRDRDNQGRDRDNQNRQGQAGTRQQNDQNRRDDDDEGDGRGRRGRRYRDRNRRTTRDRFAPDGPAEPEVRDDDVLVPVAGILDVLDSYAFIRTSGYLTGPNDVYVSLSQVRKNGLRRGDAVTGAVRAQREGEAARQKFNALVRLDSVNGLDPEQAKNRPEFTKLTPLYPNDRLRLETESHLLTTRVIDLVMPVGKGQRALIVSPPKAGKTMVMQAIANAITTNNPECHLMVVLVDERPEEVTDMQRSVKGEVIASTFDRPPADHTLVAELSIERAKRLVEMGRDVVVLLDSITRLGRAYNLAAPASGRILSGGVDSTALFPPKRFLGAARNIENGGSLTIFASALVETGSAGDTVIFEEFKGTGNAELKLDRRLADKRIFPAIDVDQSSTRKEDLLLSPDELAIVVKLRRVLSALDTQQALELVLDRLRKTRNNVEFLMQVAKTTPGD